MYGDMLTLIDTGSSLCAGTDTESIWEGDGAGEGDDTDVVLGMTWYELRTAVQQYQEYCYDGMLTAEDCPMTMVALV